MKKKTKIVSNTPAPAKTAAPKSRKAAVSGEEGRKSLELITAIYESIQGQKEIKFPFKPEKSLLGRRG